MTAGSIALRNNELQTASEHLEEALHIIGRHILVAIDADNMPVL